MAKISPYDNGVDTCDKEPIHIPGSVQSFGALIAFDDHGRITRASKNIDKVVGIPAFDLIGKDIDS